MARTLLTRALRRTLDHVHHVAAVRPDGAPEPVGRVYAQVERDFGMLAPPIALHAPAPGPLAASWVLLRETLLADGAADRAAREVVATAVSAANTCPYCVEVHGATLDGLLGRSSSAAPADPQSRALTEWGRATATRQAAERAARPFPADQLPQLGGVAVTFHYLNRMVNVFLGDSPLPPGLPGGPRRAARRMLGRFLRSGAARGHRPGRSLDLLPPAPLPAELSWAAANPTVADALARACAAVEEAGARWVPAPVRDLVAARLADWEGKAPGPSRAWVEEAVAPLAAADRPAGRLALLTAVAAYQVDAGIVDAVRAQADDAALIGLTSWASLAAARRVASWLERGTDR